MAEPRPVDFERRQHECERAMVGRVVDFNDRHWVVTVVDHLHRVGSLRGVRRGLHSGWKPEEGEPQILNVPIDELAGLVGCSCRLHGWSEVERPKLPVDDGSEETRG